MEHILTMYQKWYKLTACFTMGRLGVATVQMVRGPVEAAALGRVLMHEHVFVDNPRHYFGG